jgi:hypothetical protein
MTTTADRAVTIGVDFGTLSGRAVTARVSDGAEHGGLDNVLPGASAKLAPDWVRAGWVRRPDRATSAECASPRRFRSEIRGNAAYFRLGLDG